MLDIFPWFADLVTVRLLGMDAATGLGSAVHFFVEDVTKIFALLTVVIFAIGLLRFSLTPERSRQLIGGRNKVWAYPAAVGLGAVSPFCSCSTVPLFIGFLEARIPLGVTMAFLVASPMINEIAVIVLAAVVGWKVAALYVATGLVVGILAGLVIEKLKLERFVEDYVWKIKMGEAACCATARGLRRRTTYAWGQVKEIVGRIWVFVLIAIGIGAAIHGFVPADFFLAYASADNPLAVPIAVLAGIPLYGNASGAVPVVEALLAKGVPIGTVIALMMSIAAISLPEMVILRKVLRLPLLAIFTAILFVAFTGVGYLFNLALI